MFCPNCGAEIPADSAFCPGCGANVAPAAAPAGGVPQKKKTTPVFLAVVAVLVVAGIVCGAVFGVRAQKTAALHATLQKDWSRMEADGDLQYKLILDFSDDTLTYRFDGRYYDAVIETYTYRVVSPDTIEVTAPGGYTTEYQIRFSENKNTMIISPALTKFADREYWYRR